jgi:cytochrome c-type biogenesis protein CcmH
MTLLLLFALMTAMAILAVLWPLALRNRKARSGSDLAVYRDQLDEIERDRATGLIAGAEAEAARIEISRRLIGAADAQAAEPAPAEAATWHRKAVAAIGFVILPISAAAFYLAVGSPDLPGQPLAARSSDPQNQSVDRLIAQVEEHLASKPDDARGWEVIAPVYLRQGRFEDAVKARRNALRAGGETAEREADLGEALLASANGIVTAEAKAAFERAVALDAEDVKSRYFLGLAAEQDGRHEEAAAIWRALLSSAPADAPWADFVRSELARLDAHPAPGQRPGPSAEDVAAVANMSPEQRMEFMRGRLAQLSERLHKDEGSNVQGWMMLVNSYMQLGERDKARATLDDARRALASDPQKLRQIEQFVKGSGIEG